MIRVLAPSRWVAELRDGVYPCAVGEQREGCPSLEWFASGNSGEQRDGWLSSGPLRSVLDVGASSGSLSFNLW